jgi:hypothetical protein
MGANLLTYHLQCDLQSHLEASKSLLLLLAQMLVAVLAGCRRRRCLLLVLLLRPWCSCFYVLLLVAANPIHELLFSLRIQKARIHHRLFDSVDLDSKLKR